MPHRIVMGTVTITSLVVRVLLSRQCVFWLPLTVSHRGAGMAIQRRLDDYLEKQPMLQKNVAKHVEAGVRTHGNAVRELLLCLKPDPRPRSVLICGSARELGNACPGSCLELSMLDAAGKVCKGSSIAGDAVVIAVEKRVLRDKWLRLLLFWTLRSLPRRLQVVLIAPGLVKALERMEKSAVPVVPPSNWSWLVTRVLRKIGACWEAFV